MPAIHLLIRGKVQGVYYRASAKEMADTLGVKGWVRNTSEGDVEIVASGEPYQLRDFTEWCHRGPVAAKVKEVIITETDTPDCDGFAVLR